MVFWLVKSQQVYNMSFSIAQSVPYFSISWEKPCNIQFFLIRASFLKIVETFGFTLSNPTFMIYFD